MAILVGSPGKTIPGSSRLEPAQSSTCRTCDVDRAILGGYRYGHMVEGEAQRQIIVKVVGSDVIVRLTWSFEPMDRCRVRLRQLVEAICAPDTRFHLYYTPKVRAL